MQDTSVASERVKYKLLAHMAPEERIERLCRLWHAATVFAVAGIRLQYPQADDLELKLRLAARTMGADLAKKFLDWDVSLRGY